MGFPESHRRRMVAFLSGISVVCFAASYAVALACEVSRLVFRSGVRGMAMVGFAAAGLLAHTLFLIWRAVHETSVPLSSPFDWYLLAAWTLAAVSLWLTLTMPRTPVGMFVLPVVLALVGAAELSSREPFPRSPATQVWGAIHGIFNLAASVAVTLGAVAGLMWLIQAGRLARKQAPQRGFRMPSLERLALVSGRALAVAAWTATAGFVSGIVLNAVNRSHGLLETVPWTDPVVLRMAALVVWLIAADATAQTVRRRPHGPRVVAWLSLASALVLAVSILWGLLGPSRHGMPVAAADPQPSEAAP